MKIILKEITIKELAEGYQDNNEGGVIGYSGRLDIRPPYQREFIYNDQKRNAVIDTVKKGFPLNVMYWSDRGGDNYEVIDGQQRTISICQYVHGTFSFEGQYFHNLLPDEKEKILNYKLMVYQCTGTDSERLGWFTTINIAGEELTNQELKNAVYAGPWVTEAKRYFSRAGCPAYQIGHQYLRGSAIRQDYLETTIDWISDGQIEEYMASHQHDQNASDLWRYFQSVIAWIESTFINYRQSMKGVNWGELYKKYGAIKQDTQKFEAETARLMMDDEVEHKSGIYPYLLDRDERHLGLRVFSESMKIQAYEKQAGICPICKKHFEMHEMEGDHIVPWRLGGKTFIENLQMLCRIDNRKKSGK